jgi:hypothetical protein
MIIGKNLDIDWAYIAIPRTGSNSMIHWLRQNFGGKHFGHHHSFTFPENFPFLPKRGELKRHPACVFTSIRHPYFRACSIVRNIIRTGAPPNQIPWGKARTPIEILKRLIELSTNIEPNAYTVPEWMINQYNYCMLGRVDTVLYLQPHGFTLNELNKLPFVDPQKTPKMVYLNKTPEHFFKFSVEDLTKEEEELIYQWAEPDFKTFGFERFLKGRSHE